MKPKEKYVPEKPETKDLQAICSIFGRGSADHQIAIGHNYATEEYEEYHTYAMAEQKRIIMSKLERKLDEVDGDICLSDIKDILGIK